MQPRNSSPKNFPQQVGVGEVHVNIPMQIFIASLQFPKTGNNTNVHQSASDKQIVIHRYNRLLTVIKGQTSNPCKNMDYSYKRHKEWQTISFHLHDSLEIAKV